MMTMKVDSRNILFLCYVLHLAVFSGIISLVSSKCTTYTGKICTQQINSGDPAWYDIPTGKTQQQIENEISEALEERPFKYSACERYFIKYLMCAEKFRKCDDNRVPCRDSCRRVKKSICLKDLDKESKIHNWLTKHFDCDKLPEKDCDFLNTRTDNEILEISCKDERNPNVNGIKTYKMSMLPSHATMLDLNKEMLLKQFPMYTSEDVKYFKGKKKVDEIITKKIKPLQTLVINHIKDRFVSGYFQIQSSKTKILPIANLMKYYENQPGFSKMLFKNVQVYIVDKDDLDNAFLMLAGQEHECLDYGHFHYYIYQDDNINSVYVGESSERFLWKWVDQAEGNLDGYNAFANNVMRRMGFLTNFTLHNPTKNVIWNQDSINKLFLDNRSSISFRIPGRVNLYSGNGDIFKYQATILNLTNVKSQIAISGLKEKSSIFHFEIANGMKFADFVWILMGKDMFDQFDFNLDFKTLDKYATIKRVNIFIQSEDQKRKLPKTSHFSQMRNLLRSHKDIGLIVKAFGKTVHSKLKKPWMDAVNFTLSYQTNVTQTLKLEFQPKFTEEQCRLKEVQDWSSFKLLLSTIDYLQWEHHNDENSIKIKREHIKSSSKCSTCCYYDVFTLESLIVDFKDAFTADLTAKLFYKNQLITLRTENFNLITYWPDEKSVMNKIKRDYFNEFL